MKNYMLRSLIVFMTLFVVVGCGENSSSSTKEITSKNSSVVISVKGKNSKGTFQKQSLNIKLMTLKVYEATDASDESYENKAPIKVGTFQKVGSDWKIELQGVEKNRYFIFSVSAFSMETATSQSIIFIGLKTVEIKDGSNNIIINLKQHENANEINNLPHISNLTSSTNVDNSVQVSFSVVNPNKANLTWEIHNEGTTDVSSDFSVNSGNTTTLNKSLTLDYLPSVSNNYLIVLTTEDAVVSYTFSVTINDETSDVNVTIETAPIIEKLTLNISETTLSLVPTLSKVATTYAWEIVENLGSNISIDNPSAQTISLSEYNSSSEFKIKLTVTASSGAFSYRIYHIFGNYSSNTNVVISPINIEEGNIKKTQQTISYDYLGDVDANVKDDGFYEKGISPSYTKNPTTKVVTDNVTTLMWQDDNDTKLDWNHADKYCTDSQIGGFEDWRLPTPSELDSLKTYYPLDPVSTTHAVLLDDVFESRSTFAYWSSLKANNTDLAWNIDFKTGEIGDVTSFRRYTSRVRCVRGTMLKPTFEKNVTTGIVTDSINNLEWQDNGVFVAEPWKNAMERCENLSLGEVGNDKGWRLPNVNELTTLVKRSNNPRIDSAFTSQPSFGNSYWSSTTYFNSKAFSYTVGVATGSSGTVSHLIKTSDASSIYSRCVRDVSSSGE